MYSRCRKLNINLFVIAKQNAATFCTAMHPAVSMISCWFNHLLNCRKSESPLSPLLRNAYNSSTHPVEIPEEDALCLQKVSVVSKKFKIRLLNAWTCVQIKKWNYMSIWVTQIAIYKAFCQPKAFCNYTYFRTFQLQPCFTLQVLANWS